MLDELPPDTRNRLNDAASTWECWLPAPLGKPTPEQQLGGITNLSFLVTDGPGRWVIRLNSDIEDSGISRNDEWTILKGAHRAGITPPMVFNGQDFLISEY